MHGEKQENVKQKKNELHKAINRPMEHKITGLILSASFPVRGAIKIYTTENTNKTKSNDTS